MEWREQTRILTIVSTPRFVNHHRWVHRWAPAVYAPTAMQVLLHGHRAQLGQATWVLEGALEATRPVATGPSARQETGQANAAYANPMEGVRGVATRL